MILVTCFLSCLITSISLASSEQALQPSGIPAIDYHLTATPSPTANPLLSNTHYKSNKKTQKRAPIQLNGETINGTGTGAVRGKVGSF